MSLRFSNRKAAIIGALHAFVKRYVDSPTYDWIVPIERKGTAILRATYPEEQAAVWDRVVSSVHAAEFLRTAKSPQVLVIEDAARTGATAKKVREDIQNASPGARVTVIAFVSLGSADNQVDQVCFPGLDLEGYREIRSVVIDHLRDTGSLLLDTEHPEILAIPLSGVNDFARALAGWGPTVQYMSPPTSNNFTVCKEISHLKARLDPLLPGYATLEKGFCKARVVESTTHPGAFGIIPICFAVLQGKEGTLKYQHPRMKWPAKVGGDERVFDCVAVCLSIEILVDLMEWLRDALGDRIQFSYKDDQLRHLKAIFPEMDLAEVQAELDRASDAQRAPRHAGFGIVDDPGLKVLNNIADRLFLKCFDPSAYDSGFQRPFGYEGVAEVARSFGFEQPRVSTALDLLIDRSQIEPAVTKSMQDGIPRLFRAFHPDGEVSARHLLLTALALPAEPEG